MLGKARKGVSAQGARSPANRNHDCNGGDRMAATELLTREAATSSCWARAGLMPNVPRLARDLQTEVCIVGAGIAGLTTAYLLSRAGRRVALLDAGPLAGGQTQRTSAHLASAVDDRYFEIERLHGREAARLVAQSHVAAIDQIEENLLREQIDCDFRRLDGYLFAGNDDADTLDREYEAALRAEVLDVELVQRAPLPFFDTGRCLKFARQAQFHPLKYLAGLARCVLERRGQIFGDTHVVHVEGGRTARVQTRDGSMVNADAVVVATNTPINDRVAMHTKQAAYLTYAIAGRIPRGSVATALYWNTLDPYHYVRVQAGDEQGGDDLLIVGGEDHKIGQATDGWERLARLEAWARERFPMLWDVVHRWSGKVLEPVDGLAFIGRNPLDQGNVLIATGDSGMGMTHGTIAGILLTALINDGDHAWAQLYDPARKTAAALPRFARENLNVATQYTDWLTPGEVRSVDDIERGQGAVIRRGLHKLAVFRDEDGYVHTLSATCPHLACVVHWNDVEKGWDCPCHGSRFDALGRVVSGPANCDLARVYS